MSGLEVLGAVAGAIQLVDASLGIIKLLTTICSTLHDAPESINRRAIQLELLVEIARLIQKNPSLQTPLISSLLMNCIDKANELQHILAKFTAKLNSGKIERYWKALGGVIKENKISELCKGLEEEKSALVLCICSIDSDLLRSIDTRLVVVHDGVDELVGELSSIRETAEGVTELLKELTLVKGTTAGLRDELRSIFETVAKLANHGKGAGKSSLSSESGSPQSIGIQRVLPALRHALDRLAIDDSIELETATHATLRPPVHIESTKDVYSKEKAIECLASLGTADQSNLLIDRLSHNKLACRWFVESPMFKLWLEKDDIHSEMLYVTAKAGYGKTTIFAHTIQHLKCTLKIPGASSVTDRMALDGTKPFLMYFFFHRRCLDDDEGTATAAMRGIIIQLVQQIPDCYFILLRKYELLSAKGTFSWTLECLWSVFVQILEELSGKPSIFIVLDGIDECETISRQSFLQRLGNLLKDLNSRESDTAPCVFKVLISGRPDDQLLEIIPSAKKFEITVADTTADMENLIHSRVSQFASRRSLDSQTANNLAECLSQRSNGMFLWVVLVMKELDRRDIRLSDEVIATKLRTVPTTLFSQYEAILNKPHPSRKADMWRILRWILNAKKVMSLAELEVALCTELGIPRWHDLRGDLNYLCGSVILVDGDAVSFIHQTFRDFLHNYIARSDHNSTGGIGMGSYDTETQLATTCLKLLGGTSYLGVLNSSLRRGFLPRNQDVEQYLRARPFFSYAAEFWASHLQTADSFVHCRQPVHSLVIELFKSSLNCDLLMRLDYFFKHSKHPGACRYGPELYLAGYFKLPILVEHYISSQKKSEIFKDGFVSPLLWACETGSYECIELFLKAGADANALEFDGWSPLHWAATNGHERVCGLLIQRGANKDVQDERGFSPKDMAFQMGHFDIAEKYFGGVEGAKVWTRSKYSPDISIIGHRRAAT